MSFKFLDNIEWALQLRSPPSPLPPMVLPVQLLAGAQLQLHAAANTAQLEQLVRLLAAARRACIILSASTLVGLHPHAS